MRVPFPGWLLSLVVPFAPLAPAQDDPPPSRSKLIFPSPDHAYAFRYAPAADADTGQAYDLVDAQTRKVIVRAMQADPDPGPAGRFALKILWRPDSRAFAVTGKLWKRGSYVDVFMRSGATFREAKLPDLTADVPDKERHGTDFPHVSEDNSQSAKQWLPDGSLVVDIENILDGAGVTITANRTVTIGLDASAHARIVSSTIKFHRENQ